MTKSKHAVIITPDSLQAYGLRVLLEEYFLIEDFSFYTNINDIEVNLHKADLIFVHADFYFSLYAKLMPVKNKTIVLAKNKGSVSPDISVLDITQEQASLLEDLNNLCAQKLNNKNTQNHQANDNKYELSDREIEVLALIAKGYMNKTIADELNISINTVLTHRKNLTSKLGIKTVSGMTMYAILNGLISAEDIQ